METREKLQSSEAEVNAPEKQKVVLLIEEDRQLRSAYEEVLKASGFAVVSVGRLGAVLRQRLPHLYPHLLVVNCPHVARGARRHRHLSRAAILTLADWGVHPGGGSRLIRRRCTPEQLLEMTRAACEYVDGGSNELS